MIPENAKAVHFGRTRGEERLVNIYISGVLLDNICHRPRRTNFLLAYIALNGTKKSMSAQLEFPGLNLPPDLVKAFHPSLLSCNAF
jgi:hypothetical protein